MERGSAQYGRIAAGVAIIALGVLALLSQLDVFAADTTAWLWVIGLAVVAAAFVWLYITARESWAILGAYIAGAIALIVLFAAIVDIGDLLVPVVLLLIAAPFVAGWWLNRSEWGLLIPAYVLGAIALAFLLNLFERGNLFVTYVMWVIAAPFLLAFGFTRAWPFLIPGGIMFVIGLGFVAGSGEAIGTLFSVVGAVALIAAGGVLLFRAYTGRGGGE